MSGDDFLRACRGEPVSATPVWFMRQAGRSLPEYRAARGELGMLESCLRAEVVAEITAQPVRRLGVDAAILFSDIVVPLVAAGLDVEIVPGVGPVVAEPVRCAADVARLPELDPAALAPIGAAVAALTSELDVPLIGFAGAPFTLASYLIEGGPSRTWARTKALMLGEPATWAALMARLAKYSATFLAVQIEAGAAAVQLFDSWAGALAPHDYRGSVLPYSKDVLAGAAGVPRIHFGVGTGELLGMFAEAGAEVVGVDWRVPLPDALSRIGPGHAVQGNLDPAVLLAGWPAVRDAARRVLAGGRAAPGHVFNLGHGVLPETDPGMLARLVEFVHEQSRRDVDPAPGEATAVRLR